SEPAGGVRVRCDEYMTSIEGRRTIIVFTVGIVFRIVIEVAGVCQNFPPRVAACKKEIALTFCQIELSCVVVRIRITLTLTDRRKSLERPLRVVGTRTERYLVNVWVSC